MYKKIIPAVFIIVFASFLVIFLANRYFKSSDSTSSVSKLTVPQVNTESENGAVSSSYLDDESSLVSLIPLEDDETLISVLSQDFDGDGYDDQVNAIKTIKNPHLLLLVGIYNTKISKYERKALIETPVTQVKTFSYTGLDLTGIHRTALVYQGFSEDGESVLSAFFLEHKGEEFVVKNIAELKADGTIFIQQSERIEAYEKSQANGGSYPIWVYTTDTEKTNSTDQIQTKYDWNASEEKYVQVEQFRVAGSRLAQAELSRIQDGTVETFASFLNGLWYKTELSSDGSNCYIFFDYDAKEIIFFQEGEEKVYHWVMSTLRRNGIYLSTTSQEIESLQTRVDVSLRGVDEIHVRMQDDIRLLIKESNLWDGDYKKLNVSSYKKTKSVENSFSDIASFLEKGRTWSLDNGVEVTFKNGSYTALGQGHEDKGIYNGMILNGKSFIQFRSNTQDKIFNGMYLVTQGLEDTVTLEPYTILPNEMYPSEGVYITLKKVVLDN